MVTLRNEIVVEGKYLAIDIGYVWVLTLNLITGQLLLYQRQEGIKSQAVVRGEIIEWIVPSGFLVVEVGKLFNDVRPGLEEILRLASEVDDGVPSLKGMRFGVIAHNIQDIIDSDNWPMATEEAVEDWMSESRLTELFPTMRPEEAARAIVAQAWTEYNHTALTGDVVEYIEYRRDLIGRLEAVQDDLANDDLIELIQVGIGCWESQNSDEFTRLGSKLADLEIELSDHHSWPKVADMIEAVLVEAPTSDG